MSKHTPGPWTQDRWGNVPGGDGEPLLLAGRACLAACTRERDTVTRIDWLAALLADLREQGWVGTQADPQAAVTALYQSELLLDDLRAAVKTAREGGDRG